MAGSALADPEFWLPSEFLTDDEIVFKGGKENFNKNRYDDFCFPSEFPYEFGSSSTESESDEEDLAVLARQFSRSSLQEPLKISFSPPNLDKKRVFSGSPQSTLNTVWSSNGSPNGPSSQVPSPKTTPFIQNDNAWDLIYAAAAHVARMKMTNNGLAPLRNHHHCLSHAKHFQQDGGRSIWGKQEREDWYAQQQICQNRVSAAMVGSGGGNAGRHLDLSQSAWPPLQVQSQHRPNHHHHHHHHHNNNNGSVMKSSFLTGSGGSVKRECAGTGVFLPRRYCNPAESRKKNAAGCSPAAVPARVGQALNKNHDPMISQAQAQSNFNGGFIPHYDMVMARRNAILAQQRRSITRAEGPMNLHPEVVLPQEWTY